MGKVFSRLERCFCLAVGVSSGVHRSGRICSAPEAHPRSPGRAGTHLWCPEMPPPFPSSPLLQGQTLGREKTSGEKWGAPPPATRCWRSLRGLYCSDPENHLINRSGDLEAAGLIYPPLYWVGKLRLSEKKKLAQLRPGNEGIRTYFLEWQSMGPSKIAGHLPPRQSLWYQ